MYSKDNNNNNITEFTSDLMNSYAWDVSVLFLQEFDNRVDAVKENENYKEEYSAQIRLSEGLKNTGTNNLEEVKNVDQICNIYDIADNCWEWSTETSSNSSLPCSIRGGCYSNDKTYASIRMYTGIIGALENNSFRPILYVK